MEDSFRAPGSSKTLILIQDAHANPSGQLNLARLLDRLMEQERKLNTIFVEAGDGDESLSFFRALAPLEDRRREGLSFLKQGLLHGEEYLDLTSEKDFRVWGVEDRALYLKAIEAYRETVKKREPFGTYLARAEATLRALKPRVLNPSLCLFDEKHETFLNGEMPYSAFIDELLRRSRLLGFDGARWPDLLTYEKLKKLESGMDFTKPALELNAGELAKYQTYCRTARGLLGPRFLEEIARLTGAVYEGLERTGDERTLRRSAESVRYYRKLFRFELTPEEFDRHRRRGLGMTPLTGFLNARIMGLGAHYESALFLEPGFDELVATAESFYRLTFKRDEAFLRNALSKMDAESSKTAVLITGGFHTPHLKKRLKEAGVSYVCVTPDVLNETNHARYESLLLGQELKDTARFWSHRESAPVMSALAGRLGISPETLTTAMSGARAGARLALRRGAENGALLRTAAPLRRASPEQAEPQGEARRGARLAQFSELPSPWRLRKFFKEVFTFLVRQLADETFNFAGTEVRQMDDKWRVTLPADWREAFESRPGNVLLIPFFSDSLLIVPRRTYLKLFPVRPASISDIALRCVIQMSHVGTMDESGRILVPEKMRNYLGNVAAPAEVSLIGQGAYILMQFVRPQKAPAATGGARLAVRYDEKEAQEPRGRMRHYVYNGPDTDFRVVAGELVDFENEQRRRLGRFSLRRGNIIWAMVNGTPMALTEAGRRKAEEPVYPVRDGDRIVIIYNSGLGLVGVRRHPDRIARPDEAALIEKMNKYLTTQKGPKKGFLTGTYTVKPDNKNRIVIDIKLRKTRRFMVLPLPGRRRLILVDPRTWERMVQHFTEAGMGADELMWIHQHSYERALTGPGRLTLSSEILKQAGFDTLPERFILKGSGSHIEVSPAGARLAGKESGKGKLKKITEILNRESGSLQNGAKSAGLDGFGPMNWNDGSAAKIAGVDEDGMAASLSSENEPGLFKSADRLATGDLGQGEFGQTLTSISSSNTSDSGMGRWSSLRDSIYSSMASFALAMHSDTVSPWVAHPASAGTVTEYPPAASFSRRILNVLVIGALPPFVHSLHHVLGLRQPFAPMAKPSLGARLAADEKKYFTPRTFNFQAEHTSFHVAANWYVQDALEADHSEWPSKPAVIRIKRLPEGPFLSVERIGDSLVLALNKGDSKKTLHTVPMDGKIHFYHLDQTQESGGFLDLAAGIPAEGPARAAAVNGLLDGLAKRHPSLLQRLNYRNAAANRNITVSIGPVVIAFPALTKGTLHLEVLKDRRHGPRFAVIRDALDPAHFVALEVTGPDRGTLKVLGDPEGIEFSRGRSKPVTSSRSPSLREFLRKASRDLTSIEASGGEAEDHSYSNGTSFAEDLTLVLSPRMDGYSPDELVWVKVAQVTAPSFTGSVESPRFDRQGPTGEARESYPILLVPKRALEEKTAGEYLAIPVSRWPDEGNVSPLLGHRRNGSYAYFGYMGRVKGAEPLAAFRLLDSVALTRISIEKANPKTFSIEGLEDESGAPVLFRGVARLHLSALVAVLLSLNGRGIRVSEKLAKLATPTDELPVTMRASFPAEWAVERGPSGDTRLIASGHVVRPVAEWEMAAREAAQAASGARMARRDFSDIEPIIRRLDDRTFVTSAPLFAALAVALGGTQVRSKDAEFRSQTGRRRYDRLIAYLQNEAAQAPGSETEKIYRFLLTGDRELTLQRRDTLEAFLAESDRWVLLAEPQLLASPEQAMKKLLISSWEQAESELSDMDRLILHFAQGALLDMFPEWIHLNFRRFHGQKRTDASKADIWPSWLFWSGADFKDLALIGTIVQLVRQGQVQTAPMSVILGTIKKFPADVSGFPAAWLGRNLLETALELLVIGLPQRRSALELTVSHLDRLEQAFLDRYGDRVDRNTYETRFGELRAEMSRNLVNLGLANTPDLFSRKGARLGEAPKEPRQSADVPVADGEAARGARPADERNLVNGEFPYPDMRILDDRDRSVQFGFRVRLKQMLQSVLHPFGPRVVHPEQNNARLVGLSEGKDRWEVQVHGQDNPLFLGGALENVSIRSTGQPDLAGVDAVEPSTLKPTRNSLRDWHVEQELHQYLGGGGKGLFAGQPGAIFKRLMDVFGGQVRVFFEDLLRFFAGGQKIQDKVRRNAQPPDTRAAVQDLGVESDAAKVFHTGEYTSRREVNQAATASAADASDSSGSASRGARLAKTVHFDGYKSYFNDLERSIREALAAKKRVILDIGKVRYEIKEKISKGHISPVYRVTGPNSRASLLTFRAGTADPDFFEAFFLKGILAKDEEARAFFPAIYALYRIPTRPFDVIMEMEEIKGAPLSETPAPQRLQALLEVIREMGRLHRLYGAVHGDLNGANILLTPDGRPKMIDFSSWREDLEEDGEHSKHSDIFDLAEGVYDALGGDFEKNAKFLFTEEIRDHINEYHGTTTLPDIVGVSPELMRVLRKALFAGPDEHYESLEDLYTDLTSRGARLGKAMADGEAARGARLADDGGKAEGFIEWRGAGPKARMVAEIQYWLKHSLAAYKSLKGKKRLSFRVDLTQQDIGEPGFLLQSSQKDISFRIHLASLDLEALAAAVERTVTASYGKEAALAWKEYKRILFMAFAPDLFDLSKNLWRRKGPLRVSDRITTADIIKTNQLLIESRRKVDEPVFSVPLISFPEINDLMRQFEGMDVDYHFYYLPDLPEGSFKPYVTADLLYYFDKLSPAQRRKIKRIVAESTGNQGKAVAAAVKKLKAMYPEDTKDLKAVIFVPFEANPQKLIAMKQLGAIVVRHDFSHEQLERYIEAVSREDLAKLLELEGQAQPLKDYAHASRRVVKDRKKNRQAVYYVRHGSAQGIAGYTNIGLETIHRWLVQQARNHPGMRVPGVATPAQFNRFIRFIRRPDVQTMLKDSAFVVPGGSGGLASGIAQLKRWIPDLKVFVVQVPGADPLMKSIETGRFVTKENAFFDPVAVRHVDGIAATPERLTVSILSGMSDGIARVPYQCNDLLTYLILDILEQKGRRIEPASVLPLTFAALYGKDQLAGVKNIFVPVTGSTTDPVLIQEIRLFGDMYGSAKAIKDTFDRIRVRAGGARMAVQAKMPLQKRAADQKIAAWAAKISSDGLSLYEAAQGLAVDMGISTLKAHGLLVQIESDAGATGLPIRQISDAPSGARLAAFDNPWERMALKARVLARMTSAYRSDLRRGLSGERPDETAVDDAFKMIRAGSGSKQARQQMGLRMHRGDMAGLGEVMTRLTEEAWSDKRTLSAVIVTHLIYEQTMELDDEKTFEIAFDAEKAPDAIAFWAMPVLEEADAGLAIQRVTRPKDLRYLAGLSNVDDVIYFEDENGAPWMYTTLGETYPLARVPDLKQRIVPLTGTRDGKTWSTNVFGFGARLGAASQPALSAVAASATKRGWTLPSSDRTGASNSGARLSAKRLLPNAALLSSLWGCSIARDSAEKTPALVSEITAPSLVPAQSIVERLVGMSEADLQLELKTDEDPAAFLKSHGIVIVYGNRRDPEELRRVSSAYRLVRTGPLDVPIVRVIGGLPASNDPDHVTPAVTINGTPVIIEGLLEKAVEGFFTLASDPDNAAAVEAYKDISFRVITGRWAVLDVRDAAYYTGIRLLSRLPGRSAVRSALEKITARHEKQHEHDLRRESADVPFYNEYGLELRARLATILMAPEIDLLQKMTSMTHWADGRLPKNPAGIRADVKILQYLVRIISEDPAGYGVEVEADTKLTTAAQILAQFERLALSENRPRLERLVKEAARRLGQEDVFESGARMATKGSEKMETRSGKRDLKQIQEFFDRDSRVLENALQRPAVNFFGWSLVPWGRVLSTEGSLRADFSRLRPSPFPEYGTREASVPTPQYSRPLPFPARFSVSLFRSPDKKYTPGEGVIQAGGGARMAAATTSSRLSGFMDFFEKPFGHPHADKREIPDSLPGGDALETDDLMLGQSHRNKLFSWLGEFEFGLRELAQEFRRVLFVPERGFLLGSLEFRQFRLSFHFSSPFSAEPSFGIRHVPGRNDADDSASFVSPDDQQIPAVVRLAVNQIGALTPFQNIRTVVAGFLDLLGADSMPGDVPGIVLVPFIVGYPQGPILSPQVYMYIQEMSTSTSGWEAGKPSQSALGARLASAPVAEFPYNLRRLMAGRRMSAKRLARLMDFPDDRVVRGWRTVPPRRQILPREAAQIVELARVLGVSVSRLISGLEREELMALPVSFRGPRREHRVFALKISLLRIQKGWSIEQVRAKVRVPNAVITKWFNGFGLPSPARLKKLAGVLGTSPSELMLGRTEEEIMKGNVMGRKVLAVRLNRGWGGRELDHMLGLSHGVVYWEAGRQFPTAQNLLKLSQKTGIPASRWLTGQERDAVLQRPFDDRDATRRWFGTKLWVLRYEKGLAPEQVADALGFSRSSVWNWESNARFPENRASRDAIADFYQVDRAYLTPVSAAEKAQHLAELDRKLMRQLNIRLRDSSDLTVPVQAVTFATLAQAAGATVQEVKQRIAGAETNGRLKRLYEHARLDQAAAEVLTVLREWRHDIDDGSRFVPMSIPILARRAGYDPATARRRVRTFPRVAKAYRTLSPKQALALEAAHAMREENRDSGVYRPRNRRNIAARAGVAESVFYYKHPRNRFFRSVISPHFLSRREAALLTAYHRLMNGNGLRGLEEPGRVERLAAEAGLTRAKAWELLLKPVIRKEIENEIAPRVSSENGILGVAPKEFTGARLSGNFLRFAVLVYEAQRRLGELSVGDAVIGIDRDERTGELSVRINRELERVDGERYRELLRESQSLAEADKELLVRLQGVLNRQFHGMETQFELAEEGEGSQAAVIIELDGLQTEDFELITLPILAIEIRKRSRADKRLRFALSGSEAQVALAMDEIRRRLGAEQSVVYVGPDELPEAYRKRTVRVVAASRYPEARALGRALAMRDPQRGDIPNFYLALRAAAAYARIGDGQFETTDVRVQEFIRALEWLFHGAVDAWEVLAYLKDGDSVLADKFAFPPLARLPVDQIIRGARLALRMAEQAA